MTTSEYKFGYLTPTHEDLPFKYSDTWALQKTSGAERLIIAPSSGHVALLSELSNTIREPYGILYVLLVPRSAKVPGRYQSAAPLSRDELGAFLHRFRDFLERDARHNIWVAESGGPSLLVYDRHNVIYAYGPLEDYKRTLLLKGFKQVSEIVFPAPHSHHYNAEHDPDETALLDYLLWKFFPLKEADED